MTMELFPEIAASRARWNGQANRHRYRAAMNDVRATPQELFDLLHLEFDFTLDVAANAENTKCTWFYGEELDGLKQQWAPHRCWMNPPYSELMAWTDKARIEADAGALVVGLLPVRTEQRWFHGNVLEPEAEIRFIRGRVRFGSGEPYREKWATAPFPSMIVVWRPHAETIEAPLVESPAQMDHAMETQKPPRQAERAPELLPRA